MPPKRKWAWTWTKKDKAYIEMMKQYENNDAFAKKKSKKKKRAVWREISMKVGMPAHYCRRKWIGIKHNYLQLKYMIHTGRVTEDMVRMHIKTSKYLDGTLDFLDQFMFKIPEEELSSSARNFFDSVFGVLSRTQCGSSVEKLIKVKENSVIEVIKDYKQERGIEPMSILPNNEIYESDSNITHFKETFVNLGIDQTVKDVYRLDDDSNDVVFEERDILPNIQINTSGREEFVNLGIDQAIKEDYRINDDCNDVVFEEPDILPNIQINTITGEEFVNLGIDQAIKEDYRVVDDLNDVQFVEPDVDDIQIKQEDPLCDNVKNVTSSSLLKNILMSTKNEDTESSKKSSKPSSGNTGNLARFLVKYTNTTIDREKDEDCNLKEYMNDLAEVLCRRLVPGKRKYFLSKIDLMVSEILEGT